METLSQISPFFINKKKHTVCARCVKQKTLALSLFIPSIKSTVTNKIYFNHKYQ